MVISTADAVLYSSLLFILTFIIFLGVYIAFLLRLGNPRDEESGEVLGISLQKYVKIVLIGFLYGLVLLELNLMNAVAQNLSDITQFAGIIGGLFQLMLQLAWVWTIAIIVWLLLSATKDSQFRKEIKKGFDEAWSAT